MPDDKDKTKADEEEQEATHPRPAKDGGGEGEGESAARVAEALGVGEASAEAEKVEEAKAAPNRAARRREEAVARRRRKPAGDKGEKEDAGELPKDKNARAKELLARRQEQAAEKRPVQLLPSEMVEDALSRMTSGTGKWLRKNFSVLQWFIVGGIVVTAGVLFYLSRTEQRAGETSASLAAAVAADQGYVLEEDKRSDEEKELDTSRVFKTAEERADTALAAYNKVVDEHGGTGAALLAKLGQAGAFLDKKDYAHALEAYSAVASSTLAGADPDVKGRALEGMAFAKEGKGDLDGALATFTELESIDLKGYKELSLYHQARIHMAKGDNDKAKELLKSAREKLQAPSVDKQPLLYLQTVIDEALRKIDPSAVPARPQLGGPQDGSMTPEQIQELIRRARENAEKKKASESHEGE